MVSLATRRMVPVAAWRRASAGVPTRFSSCQSSEACRPAACSAVCALVRSSCEFFFTFSACCSSVLLTRVREGTMAFCCEDKLRFSVCRWVVAGCGSRQAAACCCPSPDWVMTGADKCTGTRARPQRSQCCASPEST